MSDSGALYANQQLQLVSLETFFRGRASALNRLDRVQDLFDERLPNLFVPNAVPGRAISLQPLQLRSSNAERGEALAIAVNQASYISFEYPGFSTFMDNALELLSPTYEVIEVFQLERVKYRYENLIAIERRDDEVLPIDEIVQSILPSGDGFGTGAINVDTDWTLRWDRGIIEIVAGIEEVGGVAALRLRVAATVVPAGPVEGLPGYASDAHDQARSCFEALITEKFRDVLRGNADE